MRSRALIVLPLAAALAVPAGAATRNEHKFKMSLTKHVPAVSSGVTFSTDRPGYKAPETGQPADRVTKTVFKMPAGTVTDYRAAALCTKAALEAGGSGCSQASVVGSGSAVAITGIPALDPLKFTVTVYNAKNKLLSYLQGLQNTVIELSMKGSTITANVPRTCLPPGTLADGCSNGEVVLKTLDVKLNPRSKSGHALITTPRKCPASGKWVSSATYTFLNGDTEKKTSFTACKK